MAAGCFSEPVEPNASGETDPDASSGPQTTDGSSPTVGESSTGGAGSTDPTNGPDESSGTTDSSSTDADGTSAGPVCGDGEVQGNEHCDGDDPLGAACLDDCTITCLDQFQDCDEIPVTGCEIDTATDSNNCGGCGHVCASGVCEDSACAPSEIAEGTGLGPGRITRVGDTFVFDEPGLGRILRWDLGDDQVQELVSAAQTGTFQRFAVANASVFWLDPNLDAAQQVPLAGGAVEFMFTIEDAGSPFASNTHLYYPTTAFVEGVQLSTLLRATHDAPATTTVVASEVPGLMCQVTQAAGRVVWAGTSFENPVRSIPAGGGEIQPVPVLAGDACNRPVFGVGPSIYLYGRVVEGGPPGLISHNLSNGVSTMLIEEPGFDGLGDYFVSGDGILADVDGEVRAYDLQGNDPHVIAELSSNSTGRYLDEQVVMWTELENNQWTLFVTERP